MIRIGNGLYSRRVPTVGLLSTVVGVTVDETYNYILGEMIE